MSDEYTQLNKLSADTARLIGWLLDLASPALRSSVDVTRIKATPMADGGMGSLRLFDNEAEDASRKFGSKASEVVFSDADGTPVTAALHLDREGRPFELDIFKADFSPLICIPPTPDSLPPAPRG
jgi:hypothetical protein